MKKYLFLILFFILTLNVSNLYAQFQTENLSSEVKAFISEIYKPDTDKKLVIYTFDGSPQCPFGKIFVDAFNIQMNNTKFKDSYLFRRSIDSFSIPSGEDGKVLFEEFSKFVSDCGIFCIIDMNDDWIYSIGTAVGEEEAQILPSLFRELQYK